MEGWWPFSEPEAPAPDLEPDCSICGVVLWRFNDVLICATCDNPEPVLPGTVPPWKDPTP